ncbi:hypothetical protein PI124_g10557 [Phytophthora idaei]|nr:hypothetical protein PI124_g10557 [Phytophthora idaei]
MLELWGKQLVMEEQPNAKLATEIFGFRLEQAPDCSQWRDFRSLPKVAGNRWQKDCLRAVEILTYVADMDSIPPLPPLPQESERSLKCVSKAEVKGCYP